VIARLTDLDGKRQSFYVEAFTIPPVYLMRLGRLWTYHKHATLPDPHQGDVTAYYRPAAVYDISDLYPMED
jgi:hypothetical protein